jgi:hypothetical protein
MKFVIPLAALVSALPVEDKTTPANSKQLEAVPELARGGRGGGGRGGGGRGGNSGPDA